MLLFDGPAEAPATILLALSPMIEIVWLDDGDHDLKPRNRVTGLTADDHLRAMAEGPAASSVEAAR